MPPDLLLALIGFAIVSSVTPGPNNLLVLTSGLNFGVPRSLPLILGICLGFSVMLTAVGIGLGSVMQASPGLHVAVKIAGLAYMLWLAWKVAASAPDTIEAGDSGAKPLSALDGATFQWVNPKAWAITFSATAAYSVPDAALASLAVIVAVFAAVAICSLSAWASLGMVMGRLIDSPGKMRAFNIGMAVLLVLSAVPVAIDLMHLDGHLDGHLGGGAGP